MSEVGHAIVRQLITRLPTCSVAGSKGLFGNARCTRLRAVYSWGNDELIQARRACRNRRQWRCHDCDLGECCHLRQSGPAAAGRSQRDGPQDAGDFGPARRRVGRHNACLRNPPPTDVGSMPQFWASFNLAQRRIQDGGWGRQVTQSDFAISSEIAGVNMRLSAGGIRELHWHQQAEWSIMTYGRCRITVLDAKGRPYVADVKEGDLWYFPAGLPHSLQGLGPDGCEFVLAFDNGVSSEFNTLPATDWMAHTPPEVLAKNFGVPAEAFKDIPLQN